MSSILTFAALFALTIVGCGSNFALSAGIAEVDLLRVATSPDVTDTVAQLVQSFFRRNWSADISTVAAQGAGGKEWRISAPEESAPSGALGIIRETATPFELVRQGRADFVVTTTNPAAGELGTLRHIGDWTSVGVEHTIALEGIELIANNALQQQAVEATDLVGLLQTGALAARARGEVRPVNLYTTSNMLFLNAAFARLGIRYPEQISKKIDVVQSNTVVFERVVADRLGVGLVSASKELPLGQVHNAISVVGIGDCGTAFPLSAATISTREYPLMREVRAFVPANPVWPRSVVKLAQRFVDYLLADDAGTTFIKSGYSPIRVTEHAPASDYVEQKLRIMSTFSTDRTKVNEFRAFVQGASQVSEIIRFGFGDREPNASAIQTIADISRWAAPQQRAGRKIFLAGFADAGGNNPAYNLQLSQWRAEAVARIMSSEHNLVVDPAEIKGFGQLGYFGCPNGGDNDRLSRRVEVWLR